MGGLSSLTDQLLKTLSGLPTNDVLREQKILALDQLAILQTRLKELEEEQIKDRAYIAQLEQQVAAQASAAQFAEHSGMLFKKASGGGAAVHDSTPYCPGCHRPLSLAVGKFSCLPCKLFNIGKPDQLHRIIAELSARS